MTQLSENSPQQTARLLTLFVTQVRVQLQVSACDTCGGQSGTGTGSPRAFQYPLSASLRQLSALTRSPPTPHNLPKLPDTAVSSQCSTTGCALPCYRALCCTDIDSVRQQRALLLSAGHDSSFTRGFLSVKTRMEIK